MEVKDEFRLHLFYLSKLIKKYPRVLVYAVPGEGKSSLLRNLSQKFPDVNFYDLGENLESVLVVSVVRLRFHREFHSARQLRHALPDYFDFQPSSACA